jgi:5-formyltetrahydrofolate cyclo-ligase
MSTAFLKNKLRASLKEKRERVSDARRKEASLHLIKTLMGLNFQNPVLSFASFGSEIAMTDFNRYLVQKGLLLLPKMSGESLEIYAVHSLQDGLIQNSFGLWEPNPQTCVLWDQPIETILIPGLAFDPAMRRLGYGKGYYDRFLQEARAALKLGIGFKEQLTEELPQDAHDKKVDLLYLF